MLGNTPAVRATASASRPQHRPTWLFSVSVTVATKWRGRGGDGTASWVCVWVEGTAAAVWRLLVLEAAGLFGSSASSAVSQSNLLEFQGQAWQRGNRVHFDWVSLNASHSDWIIMIQLLTSSFAQRWIQTLFQTQFFPLWSLLHSPRMKLWPSCSSALNQKKKNHFNSSSAIWHYVFGSGAWS